MPSTGQFVGGTMGFVAGGYPGSVAGGVTGRGLGTLLQRNLQVLEKLPPAERFKRNMLTANPAGLVAVNLMEMSPKERKRFGIGMGKTLGIETAGAGLGKVATKVTTYIGRKVMEGLLKPRVAQRGFERGWQRLLNPEFYKNRVPEKLARGIGSFFDNLTDRTGKIVSRVVKRSKKKILVTKMQSKVNELVPEGTTFANIFDYVDNLATKSNVEKKLLENETKKIMALEGEKSVYDLWVQRRSLDKLINSRSWSDDAADYLVKLRRIYNSPIRGASPEIAKAFDRYAFVKDGEYDLAKKMIVEFGPEGAVYAEKPESFASTLLSTKNDELIRRLKDLDKFNKSSDRVIEGFLDYSAAEALKDR